MIILITTTLTLFSQDVTDFDTTKKCFPIPVVKMIMKDLLSGDQAKEELKLSEFHITELEKKVDFKDSIINKMNEKEKTYLEIITDERKKYGIIETHTKKVEQALKIEKLKGRFSRSILGGGVAILTILLIIK